VGWGQRVEAAHVSEGVFATTPGDEAVRALLSLCAVEHAGLSLRMMTAGVDEADDAFVDMIMLMSATASILATAVDRVERIG